MNNDLDNASAAEIQQLKNRVNKLADEKSHLQLIINLIGGLNPLQGLDEMLRGMLHSIVDVIGGTNIKLYYWIEAELHYIDFHGEQKILQAIDDDAVAEVEKSHAFVEISECSERNLMQGEFVPGAWTWVFPLLAGTELIGILKLENLHISAFSLRKDLPVFFNHAALILSNEISNSARRKIEESLHTKTEELDSYFSNALDLFCIADTQGYFRKLNPEWAHVLGYTMSELAGRRFLDFVHPDDLPSTLDAISSLSAQKTILNFVNRYRHKDGTYRWIEWRSRPHGELIFAAARDITERKNAEEKLRLMNERFVMATRAGQIGVWDWDIAKNELLWDSSMYRLYGIPEGTFGGAYDAWARTIHPQDKAYTEGEIQAALRGEREYGPEFRIIRPDGVIRYLKADSQTFRDENGKPLRMIGTNIDITERKRMEEALAVSEQEFRSLAESSPDFIIRYDINHCMRYINRALIRFLGLAAADEVIGKQPIKVWPDGRFAIIDEVAARVLKTGNTETIESMMLAATGEYRFHQIQVVAERDVAGQIIGTIALGRDITERRGMEEEIRKLNQELEQRVAERTEQLEAANKELEAFSYSVSHDLRTPLRAIDGFSHILVEEYADKLDEEGKHLIAVVRDNTLRMGQLINDILQFSRTGRLALSSSVIDMEAMARSVLAELQAQGGCAGLEVLIGHLPTATGDAAMLRQVFVNLISNAIKFSRTRKKPLVEVGGEVAGDEIVYHVKDNGVGFDMKYADKLFGVFQRLHRVEEFEGTGIGLAIVKRIIMRHGGRVWAESKVNEGATFYFSLPHSTSEGGEV